VSFLISCSSTNLEWTRDYLLDLYNGKIETNRWLSLYQPFLVMYYTAKHPELVSISIKAEFYTSEKYSTYILSVIAMMCATVPLVVHTAAATFIVLMSVFHKFMKAVAAYLLNRMHEQKTFKWLGWLFASMAALLKLWASV
jgi:hypothetical protein